MVALIWCWLIIIWLHIFWSVSLFWFFYFYLTDVTIYSLFYTIISLSICFIICQLLIDHFPSVSFAFIWQGINCYLLKIVLKYFYFRWISQIWRIRAQLLTGIVHLIIQIIWNIAGTRKIWLIKRRSSLPIQIIICMILLNITKIVCIW